MAWPDDADDDAMPKIENALVLQEPDTFAKIWDDSVSLGIAKPAQNCKGHNRIYEN